MILNIFRVILTIVEVLLIFNLLIIVHELGHFLAARWRGLYVDKFGIWFGRPIWKKTSKGSSTASVGFLLEALCCCHRWRRWRLSKANPGRPARIYPTVGPLDKIIVAFAGPLFSFLLALVFAVIVWAVGKPTAEADATTTVGYVAPGEPAAKAGFLPGDVILAVDSHRVSRFAGIGGQYHLVCCPQRRRNHSV